MTAKNNLSVLLATGLVAGLISIVSAEDVYRSTDKDGKITYSDTPVQESTDIKQVPVPPPPDKKEVQKAKQRHQQMLRQLEAEKQRKTPPQRAREQRINTKISFREQLQQELETARSNLERSEKALKEGETPRPGERIGTVYNTSRLRPEYYERVERLKQSVENARSKVEQAEHNLRTMSRDNKNKQ